MMHTTLIVLVMFLWALCFPLIVLGLPYAPHLTFAALRAFVAGAALLLVASLTRRPFPRDRNTWLMLTAIGLGATTLGFFGMFHASEYVSPGVATVIANTQPLMAAVLASVTLGEHLDLGGKVGLSLGFLGVVLLALPGFLSGGDQSYVLGIIYIILAAVGITVSNVLIRRMAGRIDPSMAMGWQLVLGSSFLFALATLTEDLGGITWNAKFVISLLGLALPGTALAYWLWCRVLARAELNRANAFSFLVPIFGLSISRIFLQEQIGPMSALGIGLTVLGIVLANWRKQAEPRTSSEKNKVGFKSTVDER